ncbi:MAG: hypothetical protein WB615_08235 [Candidatus Tumulicola sp.]
MAAKKKTAKKSMAKRAPAAAKKTAKKVASAGKTLAKKTTSAASNVMGKTKQVGQRAQRVGKIIGVIGNLLEAGGKAAEGLTTKVESGGRKALASRKSSEAAKSATRKKR